MCIQPNRIEVSMIPHQIPRFAISTRPIAPRKTSSSPIAGNTATTKIIGTGTTDAFGKFHDLDNLYCADGSLFTSSSGHNPTLTIHACALRVRTCWFIRRRCWSRM